MIYHMSSFTTIHISAFQKYTLCTIQVRIINGLIYQFLLNEVSNKVNLTFKHISNLNISSRNAKIYNMNYNDNITVKNLIIRRLRTDVACYKELDLLIFVLLYIHQVAL